MLLQRFSLLGCLLFTPFAQAQEGADTAPLVQAASPAPVVQAGLSWQEAEQMLLANNPDLAQARSAADGARADVQMADTSPNPVLSVSTQNINPSRGLGSGSLIDKRMDSIIRLDQTIERGGKRDWRVRAAQHAEQASTADLADVQRQLRTNLAAAFVDVMAAQLRHRISEEDAALANRMLVVAEQRQRAGDMAGVDVARVRADTARAENDVAQIALDHYRAQLALTALLGNRLPASSLRVQETWAMDAPPATARREGKAPQSEWHGEPGRIESTDAIEPDWQHAIERRADVRAARQRVEQADALRQLASAQRTRDVSVGVQFEHYPPDGSRTFGVFLSVPIFVGNDYRGDIAKAEAVYLAAQQQLESVRIAATNDVLRLQAEYASQLSRYQRVKDQVLPAAEKAGEAAVTAFRIGGIALADYLDIHRSLRAARLEAVQAHAEAARAWYALRFALSGDTQE